MLVTGLSDPEHTLHDELEKGKIIVKNQIQKFTSQGVLFDNDTEETSIDFVIFATGYKQCISFIDPEIVDMRFERKGNDVPLYKYMFPIHQNQYSSLCFINFIQSATFLCSDLQTRLFVRVLKNEIHLPPVEQQEAELFAVRKTLCAQYLDRQQLRIQAGLNLKYYDDLATWIGCYPGFFKLLNERPTAFWHAWLTPWQSLHYRLVGTGRLETTESAIEKLYYSRFYGVNPFTGKKKKGPKNRGVVGSFLALGVSAFLCANFVWYWLSGYNMGDKIEDKLEENLAYAAKDPVPHNLNFGDDSSDVKQLLEN